MLADEQLRIVIERIIGESILGIYTDDPLRPATIPNAYAIEKAVRERLMEVGLPTFKDIHQIEADKGSGELIDISSASKFNANLYTLIDDITTITNNILGQIYLSSRQFYASELEMNKLGLRLRAAYREVMRVLLTHRNTSGFLHATGDKLDSMTNIDEVRTYGIEISNGSAKLKSLSSKVIDISTVSISFNAFIGSSYTINNIVTDINNYNTTIKDMLDNSMDTYWMITFTPPPDTGPPLPAGIRLVIPLSNTGKEVAVNRVELKTHSESGDDVPTKCTLRYMNSSTSNFTDFRSNNGASTVNANILVGGSKGNSAGFIITPTSYIGGISNRGISSLELTLTKDGPDKIDGKNCIYTFIIKDLKILSQGCVTNGELVTRPMKFTGSASDYSVNQVSLWTEQFASDDSRIDYYVGVDPWERGYLELGGTEVVISDPDELDKLSVGDADTWYPDQTRTGKSGVRASVIRKLGLAPYTDWNPYWVPIMPVGESAVGMSPSGMVAGQIVNLGAYQVNENVSNFTATQDTTSRFATLSEDWATGVVIKVSGDYTSWSNGHTIQYIIDGIVHTTTIDNSSFNTATGITSINCLAGSNSGHTLPAYREVENVSLPNNTALTYYRVYQFPSEPKGVTLRQGRHSWLQKTNDTNRYKKFEVDTSFREVAAVGRSPKYYIDIGPDYTSTTGYIDSPGRVAAGSIDKVMWVGGNIDNPDEALNQFDDIANNIIGDVYIEYGDGTATIHKDTAAVYSTPGNQVKVRFTYIEPVTYSTLETYVYVPRGSYPYLVINNVEGVQKAIISTPDNEVLAPTEYSGSSLREDGVRLLLQVGWNKVIIYLSAGAVWDPTTSVTMPVGMDWYAHFAPLEQVGINTLYYGTHRDDHTKCAVRPLSGVYYLVVNDPLASPGTIVGNVYQNDGNVYWSDTGLKDESSDIFGSSSAVNSFYDLTYTVIGDYYTHIMVKATFNSYVDGVTPVLYTYEVRGGDDLNIVVGG